MQHVSTETLRRLFTTWDDEKIKNRLDELSMEIEDGRNTTSVSDVGQSFTSERLVNLERELKALMDVAERRGLIDTERSPRGAYAYVRFPIGDR